MRPKYQRVRGRGRKLSTSLSIPDAKTRRNACEREDISRGRYSLLFWGAPIALDILVSLVLNLGWVSLSQAGVLWTTATFWIGASCLINARRCSRTHCLIAGGLLLPLGAAGLANVLGLISFSWNMVGIYWDTFWAIVVIAFAAEFLWKPYYRC